MKKIKKINGSKKKIQKERKIIWRYHDMFLPPHIRFLEDEYPEIFNYQLYREKITGSKRVK